MPLTLIVGAVVAGIIQGAAVVPARESVVLRADAGLGGLARPGRWMPVRVEIDNRTGDLKGEVVVEWGDARVHRAIDVPAPSRTRIELYIRTSDPRGSAAVRVIAGSETVASLEMPVRIAGEEEPLVLCAANDASAAVDDPPCTVTMRPEAFPRSMRGYVAASEVRLPPGAEARLDRAQRSAVQRWRAFRDLEANDLIARIPRAPLAATLESGAGRPARLAAVTAMALLLCASAIWMRRGDSALRSYAAVGVASALGIMVAAFAGRIGPGAELMMRQSTTIAQIGDGALVSMRGSMVYPAYASYTTRVMGFDGDVSRRPAEAPETWFDVEGTPVLDGTFGRGARQDIEVDGVMDYAPLQVSADGVVVRVRNQSESALTECSFPEGFDGPRGGTLEPGSSTTARAVAPADVPFFSCVLPAPALAMMDRRFPVRLEGTTIVSIRLPDVFRAAAVE